jgi:hypothetical protein
MDVLLLAAFPTLSEGESELSFSTVQAMLARSGSKRLAC